METEPIEEVRTEDNQEATTEASVEEFSPKQVEVLVALVNGASVTAAAEASGLNRSTVHRWLQNPRFVMERNRMLQERQHQLRAKAVSLGDLALEKLKELLNDEYEPNRVAAVRLACKISGLEP